MGNFVMIMQNMKKLLPAALLLFMACNQNNEHSDSFVHARVDSIVGTRVEEINRRAMEDLDQRMTIEVKQKADSMVAARRAAMQKNADTLKESPAGMALQAKP
jgi:hypothetical protein